MKRKTKKRSVFKNGRDTVITEQSANATVGQGGNAIAINASEGGIIRIQPPR
ncbi:hypothetical protein [Paenibacillus contaminans]|jgi:hypothetical protein|uniref:hypothetical protein n=1 Tax=Paenibacillus contaminans TaxID=450362 RepID=UPI00186407A5|nr:hypothetical protein [Paenibacillus contaminans]